MGTTDSYKADHTEIKLLIQSIFELLEKDKIRNHITEILVLINKTSAIVNDHIHKEDKVLFPILLCSSSQEVSNIAKQFIRDTSGFHENYNSYISKWVSREEFHANPEGFINATRNILTELDYRNQKEDEILYPLIEHL